MIRDNPDATEDSREGSNTTKKTRDDTVTLKFTSQSPNGLSFCERQENKQIRQNMKKTSKVYSMKSCESD
jgi:hypothetical protein